VIGQHRFSGGGNGNQGHGGECNPVFAETFGSYHLMRGIILSDAEGLSRQFIFRIE
jgi:hypothetical protein